MCVRCACFFLCVCVCVCVCVCKISKLQTPRWKDNVHFKRFKNKGVGGTLLYICACQCLKERRPLSVLTVLYCWQRLSCTNWENLGLTHPTPYSVHITYKLETQPIFTCRKHFFELPPPLLPSCYPSISSSSLALFLSELLLHTYARTHTHTYTHARTLSHSIHTHTHILSLSLSLSLSLPPPPPPPSLSRPLMHRGPISCKAWYYVRVVPIRSNG